MEQYQLDLNPTLVNSIIESTSEGLAMTGIRPRAIGASSFTMVERPISVLLGLHGSRNGNMTMNLSDRTAMFLAGKFLAEDYEELNEEVVDAVCELGNIVAGSVKALLQNTEYAFETISLPALVFGSNYNVYHLKNITTVTVTFEISEISVMRVKDKFFTTTLALMEG